MAARCTGYGGYQPEVRSIGARSLRCRRKWMIDGAARFAHPPAGRLMDSYATPAMGALTNERAICTLCRERVVDESTKSEVFPWALSASSMRSQYSHRIARTENPAGLRNRAQSRRWARS